MIITIASLLELVLLAIVMVVGGYLFARWQLRKLWRKVVARFTR